MKVNLLRTTYHPVVKTYMDVIQKGLIHANIPCCDVMPGDSAISKKDFLLTDSPLIAIKYILKGFRNHIVWFQGVSPEESFMSHKSHVRSALISQIEKIVLKKAKLVFLVSEAMKRHYENKYKIDLSAKCFIMPCFNETGVYEDAFSSEKYEANSFLYVGSLLPWQCFEETVDLYSRIERQSTKPTKFYVFTQQKEEALNILQRYHVKHYVIDCVSKEELSNRIKHMKYGFVIREDSVVNNVATPTKFSNYLANGIIPIYSSSLRSFAAFDEGNNLGIVCDLDSLENGTRSIFEHMESDIVANDIYSKCKYAFDSYYNAEQYVIDIANLANGILNNN